MLWHNNQGKVIKPWQYKNFATIFFQLSLYLSFPINFFSQWTANSKYKKQIKYILERFHHVAKCTTKCCISCQSVSFTLADLKLDWIICIESFVMYLESFLNLLSFGYFYIFLKYIIHTFLFFKIKLFTIFTREISNQRKTR